VRYAPSRGHKVTLFNRGRRPNEWPVAVEELTGDREPNDYASLKDRKFDVCIDNSTSVPHWIRDAAAVLKGNVRSRGQVFYYHKEADRWLRSRLLKQSYQDGLYCENI
jgi:hypothetical protein